MQHLKNPQQRQGIIERLLYDLHVAFGEKGRSKVRIRVFSVGKDGLPDKDLLTTEIIKTIDRLTPNLNIDLKKYNILFPAEGVFIGLEFFCTFDLKPKRNSPHSLIKTNCPHIPTAKVMDYNEKGCSYFWTEYKGKMGWLNYSNGVFYPRTKGHVFKFGAVVAY